MSWAAFCICAGAWSEAIQRSAPPHSIKEAPDSPKGVAVLRTLKRHKGRALVKQGVLCSRTDSHHA